MIKIDCQHCGRTDVPLNDTIKVDGLVYCKNCFDKSFPDESLLKGKVIERNIDPTICSYCHKDFDDQELKTNSKYRICPECALNLKKKIMPGWVKAFFAGILFIVLASFAWNWKYYDAYQNLNESTKLFAAGNYDRAGTLMQKASDEVPEIDDLKSLASFYQGLAFLTADKNDSAYRAFESCQYKLPADYKIGYFLNQAKIGVCFDKHDYQGFLEASKANLALDSTLAVALTSVASAYACLYADRGDDSFKQNALSYLQRAKLIDGESEDMKVYYNMIEYRLDSRRIIKREEFISEFPNGWTKN